MPTDPAAKARGPETTALRVLEKNVPTAMVFPVMVNHVVTATLVHLLAGVTGQHMETVHHDLIAPIAQDMQIVVNAANVLHTETVHSAEIALHMVSAVSVPVTATVMGPLVATVLVMGIVTELLVQAAPHVHQVIALHTETVATVILVQNEAVSAVAVLMVLFEVSDLVSIGENALHSVTVTVVQNAVIAPSTEIVHSVQNALPTAIEAHAQHVAIDPHTVTALSVVTDQHTENVQNVPVMVTEVVVLTVLALLALEVVILVAVMIVSHALKNRNSLKSSVWRANYEWFAPTTTTPGSMTMSPVMNSTRLHATSSRPSLRRTLSALQST